MTFDLFAFDAALEDHTGDLRRKGIPAWRLAAAVEWAAGKGHDTILLQRNGTQPTSSRSVTHHVCSDPGCPGGCE